MERRNWTWVGVCDKVRRIMKAGCCRLSRFQNGHHASIRCSTIVPNGVSEGQQLCPISLLALLGILPLILIRTLRLWRSSSCSSKCHPAPCNNVPQHLSSESSTSSMLNILSKPSPRTTTSEIQPRCQGPSHR